MRAMVMTSPDQPLAERELPTPQPGPHDILARVKACGVCRTDLHVLDGELPEPKPQVLPGHGEVVAIGKAVSRFRVGDRVGIPWLGQTCGRCQYCRSGREDLCDAPRFTGLYARRRLCRIHVGSPGPLPSHPERLQRCRGGPTAVRPV